MYDDSHILDHDLHDVAPDVHEVVSESQEKVDDFRKNLVHRAMNLPKIIESLHENEAKIEQKEECMVVNVVER